MLLRLCEFEGKRSSTSTHVHGRTLTREHRCLPDYLATPAGGDIQQSVCLNYKKL